MRAPIFLLLLSIVGSYSDANNDLEVSGAPPNCVPCHTREAQACLLVTTAEPPFRPLDMSCRQVHFV